MEIDVYQIIFFLLFVIKYYWLNSEIILYLLIQIMRMNHFEVYLSLATLYFDVLYILRFYSKLHTHDM